MNIQDLHLKENPFEYLTPIQGEVKNWAGMKEIKQNIENVYINSFNRNPRNVILNWGPLGCGKTYAAYYFKNYIVEGTEKSQIINLYTRTPKEGTKVTEQVFKDILDSITYRKLKEYIQASYKELGEKKLFEFIYEKINSEEFAQAVVNLGKEENIFNVHIFDLMKKYIFNNISKSELNSLKLVRTLDSDSDYRKFLAGIILAITASNKPKRVFLWIDEMEDLIVYTSKQYKEFSQILRDLADTVGERFTLFMNFTFSDPEKDNVRIIVGEALWSRINHFNYFNIFNIEHAVEYVRDLINFSQIDNSKGAFFPFEEDVITKLLKNLKPTDLIPREINRNVNDLIQFALNQNKKQIVNEVYKLWFNSNNII